MLNIMHIKITIWNNQKSPDIDARQLKHELNCILNESEFKAR